MMPPPLLPPLPPPSPPPPPPLLSNHHTWEWWSSPCPLDPAGWYVRIDLDTHYWRVAYRGKVVVSEIFL